MAVVDITTLIGQFVAATAETSLVLPHMTTGQRKSAKKFMEEFPELRCESYGFGAERQLHLFKKNADVVQPESASQALDKSCDSSCLRVNVKNTFIDGWVALEPEPILFRSLPSRSGRRSLDFASIVQMSSQGEMEIVSPTSFDSLRKGSTVSESLAASDNNFQFDVMQKEAQVQNTFIHVSSGSTDEGIVQSMPNGMFSQCVAVESSEGAMDYVYDTPTTMGYDSPRTASESEPEEVCVLGEATYLPIICSLPEAQAGQSSLADDTDWLPLVIGSLVVVEGLLQAPAFNGRSAVVQDWDEAIGRYCVLFADQGGCQQAKLKPENLRMVLPPLE